MPRILRDSNTKKTVVGKDSRLTIYCLFILSAKVKLLLFKIICLYSNKDLIVSGWGNLAASGQPDEFPDWLQVRNCFLEKFGWVSLVFWEPNDSFIENKIFQIQTTSLLSHLGTKQAQSALRTPLQ